MTSIDALNWTVRALPVPGALHAATFGAGKFVSAGTVGGILTSIDGVQWVHQPAFGDAEIRSLAFGGSQFVAVGKRKNSGIIWTSADGLSWTESATAVAPLEGVAYGNGSFVAVGDGGLVMQSTGADVAQLMIARRDPNTVEISCYTEAGRACRLQASSDGRDWRDLTSFIASASGDRYIDTVHPAAIRLYRVVSP